MSLSVVDVIAPPDTDSGTADFARVRPRLLRIAYRVLGQAEDAEDVVQDVWLRWQRTDRAQVRDRVAFLVTVTTRAALNAATTARARHEVSTGGWVAECGSASLDPVLGVETSETIAIAVDLLMRRLSPAERAVYVLREAFDYPFREIADMLGTSEPGARQLARRSRTHLTGPARHGVDPAERDELLEVFRHAARTGDVAQLINLLTTAVTRRGKPVSAGRRGASRQR